MKWDDIKVALDNQGGGQAVRDGWSQDAYLTAGYPLVSTFGGLGAGPITFRFQSGDFLFRLYTPTEEDLAADDWRLLSNEERAQRHKRAQYNYLERKGLCVVGVNAPSEDTSGDKLMSDLHKLMDIVKTQSTASANGGIAANFMYNGKIFSKKNMYNGKILYKKNRKYKP